MSRVSLQKRMSIYDGDFFAKTVNGLKSLVLQKQKDINQKMSKT